MGGMYLEGGQTNPECGENQPLPWALGQTHNRSAREETRPSITDDPKNKILSTEPLFLAMSTTNTDGKSFTHPCCQTLALTKERLHRGQKGPATRYKYHIII